MIEKANDTKQLLHADVDFTSYNVQKTYNFQGWDNADTPAVTDEYPGINTPTDLYDALSHIWCEYTCAPRLRDRWKKENMTLGQCSITAFLAQDIFGGDVYGIKRPGGNYHCYNVIGKCKFDLTSEQFGQEILDYENNPVQLREDHFAKEEKRLRYEYLKTELKKYLQFCIWQNSGCFLSGGMNEWKHYQ